MEGALLHLLIQRSLHVAHQVVRLPFPDFSAADKRHSDNTVAAYYGRFCLGGSLPDVVDKCVKTRVVGKDNHFAILIPCIVLALQHYVTNEGDVDAVAVTTDGAEMLVPASSPFVILGCKESEETFTDGRVVEVGRIILLAALPAEACPVAFQQIIHAT